MRAREADTLDNRPASRRSCLVRKALATVARIAPEGRKTVLGGEQILIADALTGRVLVAIEVSSGDDGFLRSRMYEDLLTMSAEDSAAKYLEHQPDNSSDTQLC